MSKIFRLYEGGTDVYEGWNDSPTFPYNSTSRDTIKDPDGASAKNEITSIPSPFARIDLIKTAFKEVCKNDIRGLSGNTIFHKMVSDTLDVAEIFFNIDKFNGIVEVINWDASQMVSELQHSNSEGHRYLADALTKYMQLGANASNWGRMKNIYLLNYVNGPDYINIIGATSPATLFFSSANDLGFVKDIYFKNDSPFDNEYKPLYDRDFNFIMSLFLFRHTTPNFARMFPEVEAYLSLTLKAIGDPNKKQQLRNLSPADLKNYEAISVGGNLVEVLGFNLLKKKSGVSVSKSAFAIKCSKTIAPQPLVLPIEPGNKYSDLQYTVGTWGNINVAPYKTEEDDLSKRKLPFEGSTYPYLTISDFMEDILVRVPYTLNTECYFNGNIDTNKETCAYLLPLTPRFFDYFTVEDLMGEMANGEKMFEMELVAGGSVKTVLRIPINGDNRTDYIEYSRIYYNGRKPNVTENVNDGGIVEFSFTGFIMPLIRFTNSEQAIYDVSCVSGVSSRYDFTFYSQSNKISLTSKSCRNEDKQGGNFKAETYHIEYSNFDFIRISDRNGNSGLIVPIFKEQKSIDTFEFAIDLGTSNTHVEYRKSGENSKVFSLSKEDKQHCEIFLQRKDDMGNAIDLILEKQLIEKDFLPDEIGTEDFRFPTRTVLSYAKTTDWTNVIEPFALVNIPFTYDKRRELPYNNFKYNIKWGSGEDDVIDSYVRCLMLIIRNKVLLNNGDLQKTKITWFYPISMAPKRLKRLQATWDNAFKKYFCDGTTNRMTESSAPIQYFFKRYATATNLINIDIGGGTTDIAFSNNKKIDFVTSFRFASNVLFENSFSDLDENNGIVDYYKSEILKLLEDKGLSELVSIFNSSCNSKPANMASFLFGLRDNTIVKKAKVNDKKIDFNYILQEDEKFKIVFIIFYTAIIYHIAQIVKAKRLDVPRHISFSGNGSKVIRIITPDAKLLAKYTKLIFESVLNKPYGKELEILGMEKDYNPKESTCKGGIVGEGTNDVEDIIVFKSDCSGFVTPSDTYDCITDEYKITTIQAVKDFFDFTLKDMNDKFNFDKNFGVDYNSFKIAYNVSNNDLDTYLEKGIAQRKEESENTDTIEETFFFYPIKGVLHAISQEIYQSLLNE